MQARGMLMRMLNAQTRRMHLLWQKKREVTKELGDLGRDREIAPRLLARPIC